MRPRTLRLHRLLDRILAGTLDAVSQVVAAMPKRMALAVARFGGRIAWFLDRRGRKAGEENLRSILGESTSEKERRRILRASYRSAADALCALLHLRRGARRRFREWVYVSPETEAEFRRVAALHTHGVFVSGHCGNWELLLAARSGLEYVPKVRPLVESTGFSRVDALLDRLRNRGGGSVALRKGGALAMKSALHAGESVAILIDRNVRRDAGGVWAPFLGLPARTTPLPALLARRSGVPLSVILCLPIADARWTLWMSRNLMDAPTENEDADVRRITAAANEVLGEVIRARPDTWLWSIKRWKSRPSADPGRYPSYSIDDTDWPEGMLRP